MHQHPRSVVWYWLALVLAGALVLGACGGDDGPAADATVGGEGDASDELTGEGPAVEGSVGDDDLLVPRAYLQGEWCDSDGQTWTIDGDTVRSQDTSGGGGELPVDLVFIDNPDTELVSQTDDEFVISNRGDETTFTRGSC